MIVGSKIICQSLEHYSIGIFSPVLSSNWHVSHFRCTARHAYHPKNSFSESGQMHPGPLQPSLGLEAALVYFTTNHPCSSSWIFGDISRLQGAPVQHCRWISQLVIFETMSNEHLQWVSGFWLHWFHDPRERPHMLTWDGIPGLEMCCPHSGIVTKLVMPRNETLLIDSSDKGTLYWLPESGIIETKSWLLKSPMVYAWCVKIISRGHKSNCSAESTRWDLLNANFSIKYSNIMSDNYCSKSRLRQLVPEAHLPNDWLKWRLLQIKRFTGRRKWVPTCMCNFRSVYPNLRLKPPPGVWRGRTALWNSGRDIFLILPRLNRWSASRNWPSAWLDLQLGTRKSAIRLPRSASIRMYYISDIPRYIVWALYLTQFGAWVLATISATTLLQGYRSAVQRHISIYQQGLLDLIDAQARWLV